MSKSPVSRPRSRITKKCAKGRLRRGYMGHVLGNSEEVLGFVFQNVFFCVESAIVGRMLDSS